MEREEEKKIDLVVEGTEPQIATEQNKKYGKLSKKNKLKTSGVKKVIGGLGGKQHNECWIG